MNLRIRNDIATLILAGILALPSWNLVSSGIAEDIISFLPVIEFGNIQIWGKQVKFSDCDEDLIFKRTLLLIIAHLAHIDVYVFVMQKAMIIPIILRIIKFCIKQKEGKGFSSSLILFEHTMHILSLLASLIAVDFMKYKGTFTLLKIIDQILSEEFDEHLVMIFTRTICTIIMQDDVLVLEDFRKHNMILLLIKLARRIMSLDKFTMRRQRCLTLVVVALEGLLKKQTSVQQMYGKRSVELVTEIFEKCLCQKKKNSHIDQRLLLAIGSYLWECIARCPTNIPIFLKSNGLYFMLDIIEITRYPVRCLYLGALTDICDCTFCGPFLCTWRDADKKRGLISLLATIWREEEDRIGIKRHDDGSIEDPELPQMGTKQWTDTYRSILTADACPTMVDMFGSMRSKIFSILTIIKRDNEKYEIAKKHYKILLDDLPTEDRITLCCADMYLRLKLGQMWIELSRYLEQAGIMPLSVDAHLVSHMVQWHRSWGIFIEEDQKKLVAKAKHVEEVLEKDEFAKLRDSKLAPTLEALNEVDRIRRTTDRLYMLRKKDQQRRKVNAALSFPRDADVEHCHRTFMDKTNVTVILRQHQSIDSSHLEGSSFDLTELPPVSPPDSPHEETFSSLGGASNGSSFYNRRFEYVKSFNI